MYLYVCVYMCECVVIWWRNMYITITHYRTFTKWSSDEVVGLALVSLLIISWKVEQNCIKKDYHKNYNLVCDYGSCGLA